MEESKHWSENLKVTLAARLDVDEVTKQKIENFSKALSELPTGLNIRISMDGIDTEKPLVFNVADFIIDQVKEHFGK